MYDYPERVKEYLDINFTPAPMNECNMKVTTAGLLAFIFQVFPKDCITNYQLTEILFELGYQPRNHFEKIEEEEHEDGEEWKKSLKPSEEKITVLWFLLALPTL